MLCSGHWCIDKRDFDQFAVSTTKETIDRINLDATKGTKTGGVVQRLDFYKTLQNRWPIIALYRGHKTHTDQHF